MEPPFALVLAERWFFGTHVIASQIGLRLWGLPQAAFHPNLVAWLDSAAEDGAVRAPAHLWSFFNIGGFLSNSQTWIGAGIGITSTRLFPAVIWMEWFFRNSSASNRAATVSK